MQLCDQVGQVAIIFITYSEIKNYRAYDSKNYAVYTLIGDHTISNLAQLGQGKSVTFFEMGSRYECNISNSGVQI